MSNAKPDILGIQQRDVNCVDAKRWVRRTMIAIERVANAIARKIMMDTNAKSVRLVIFRIYFISFHLKVFSPVYKLK